MDTFRRDKWASTYTAVWDMVVSKCGDLQTRTSCVLCEDKRDTTQMEKLASPWCIFLFDTSLKVGFAALRTSHKFGGSVIGPKVIRNTWQVTWLLFCRFLTDWWGIYYFFVYRCLRLCSLAGSHGPPNKTQWQMYFDAYGVRCLFRWVPCLSYEEERCNQFKSRRIN